MGLLGHVLTLEAGTNYESLVVGRICRPLKMDSTRITLTPELQSRFATGHNEIGEAVPSWDLPTLPGAGAIRSTANDLLKYVSANLGLEPSTLTPLIAKTHAVYVDRTNGPHMGLAWFTTSTPQKTKIILHDGATAGCSAFIGFDKARRRGVVILSNSTGVLELRNLGILLLDSDWQSLEGLCQKLPKIPGPTKQLVAIKLDPKLLDACVGHYEFGSNAGSSKVGKASIWREGDQLVGQVWGENVLQGAFNIYSQSETNFFLKLDGSQLTFIKNAKGHVTAVIHHSAHAGVPDIQGKKVSGPAD
jgi:hypothetical protein